VYGTHLSLVLGNTEQHQTAVREYPEASGEMIVLQSKVGFSPDLESTRLWERDFKRQATLGQAPAISEYGLQVLGVFMLASHMCRFEDDLLLSSSLRLTHILLAVCRSIKL
jgi:hypothetical protein